MDLSTSSVAHLTPDEKRRTRDGYAQVGHDGTPSRAYSRRPPRQDHSGRGVATKQSAPGSRLAEWSRHASPGGTTHSRLLTYPPRTDFCFVVRRFASHAFSCASRASLDRRIDVYFASADFPRLTRRRLHGADASVPTDQVLLGRARAKAL